MAAEGTRVWLDGAVLAPDAALVSALDHGITVGDGVFETCAVRGGVPFALTRHLARLARSARAVGLTSPPDADVRTACSDVLSAAPGRPALLEGRLRITWTAGPGPLGSDRTPGRGTLVVAAAPATASPATAGSGPVRVATVPWTRNERAATAGVKSTSYLDNVVALAWARERSADEAVFGNTRGELCEGTGSNVWVAVDAALATPPLSSGCLAGITRELLLEWAAEEGLPVVERVLPLSVLRSCDEVLITSSTRDVQPVAAMDGRALVPGPLGAAAQALFARRAASSIDP